MFKWVQSLLKRKPTELEDKLAEQLDQALQRERDMNARLEQLTAQVDQLADPPLQPPSFTITDLGPQPDGTTRWEFEWNDEFISLLREHGYVGDEDKMVNDYLNGIFVRHARPEIVGNNASDISIPGNADV